MFYISGKCKKEGFFDCWEEKKSRDKYFCVYCKIKKMNKEIEIGKRFVAYLFTS